MMEIDMHPVHADVANDSKFLLRTATRRSMGAGSVVRSWASINRTLATKIKTWDWITTNLWVDHSQSKAKVCELHSCTETDIPC
jgi:hypothetical protein